MKILIIGCGAIGITTAREIAKWRNTETIYMYDKDPSCSAKLSSKEPKVQGCQDIISILPEISLVIEAASQNAVSMYAPTVLSHGKSILIMSIGALADDNLRISLEKIARDNKCSIYLPSGAVAGIDALSAASNTGVEEVILITYKPTAAFRGNEYLNSCGIDITKINQPTVLFNGSAREAIKYFPQNINVAATVSLNGIGFDRTKVKIIADPKATMNTHRLIVKGEFGEFETETRNLPSPRNPKTSYMAALSAISAVKKIVATVWVPV